MRSFVIPALSSCLFAFSVVTSAQMPTQIVHWSGTVSPQTLTAGKGGTATLNASINPGWHVYAISQPPGGPKAATVRIPEGQDFKAAGAVTGTKPKNGFDQNFNMNTEYYEKSVSLQLPVMTDAKAAPGSKTMKVDVRFQTCNDRLCLPPSTAHVEIPTVVKH